MWNGFRLVSFLILRFKFPGTSCTTLSLQRWKMSPVYSTIFNFKALYAPCLFPVGWTWQAFLQLGSFRRECISQFIRNYVYFAEIFQIVQMVANSNDLDSPFFPSFVFLVSVLIFSLFSLLAQYWLVDSSIFTLYTNVNCVFAFSHGSLLWFTLFSSCFMLTILLRLRWQDHPKKLAKKLKIFWCIITVYERAMCAR